MIGSVFIPWFCRIGNRFGGCRFGLPDPLSEAGESTETNFFTGSFYPGESIADSAGLSVECDSLWDGDLFCGVVRERNQCRKSGLFLYFHGDRSRSGPSYFRTFGRSRKDSSGLDQCTDVPDTFVCRFALFHNEIVFFASALAIGIGFGVCVPAIQCLL